MAVFKRLLKLAKPHTGKFLVALLLMLAVGLSTAGLAFLVKPALDDIFFEKKASMLYLIPLAILAIYFIKGICTYGQAVLMNYIGQRIVTDLRNDLHHHIHRQSLFFFQSHPTGTLISRITNDVNLIQSAVSEALTSLLKDSFSLIGLIFVIFYRDWQLAIIAAFVFPLTIYPIAKFGEKLRKVATGTQVTLGSLTSLLQETISGIRIVKAFGTENYEGNRFGRENEQLFRLFMKSASLRAISGPFMEFLGGVGIAAIVFYGGYQVIQGTSTAGTFFSFLTALIMLYEPVKRLTNVNNTIQQGIAGAVRVFQILDLEPDIGNRPGAVTLSRATGEIRIEGVSFRYEDAPVLRKIHLAIRPGEIVAFVGSSGAGKTTLVHLIPRFYDVTEGRITLDGKDVRDITLESLRAQISMVTQQTILFNDTVRNNIAYGVEKDDRAVREAARAANAHHFIEKLPRGYDTVLGEQGIRLSGGERQRITIARAILKNAPVLILDEATSSLDTESEREVQVAIDNLMRGRTTLVIAHRLSTIQHAHRICVLSAGEIVEEGTHEELLEMQGEYSRLYALQFREPKEGLAGGL
jgi:subfamily B ATP-binding cassette protein MsbA